MNMRAIRWAVRQDAKCPQATYTLIKLATKVDKNLSVVMRHDDLGELCGYCRVTADKMRKRLEARGLIRFERIVFHGRKSTNRYELAMP